MRHVWTGVFLLLVAFPSYAEIVTLVCEYAIEEYTEGEDSQPIEPGVFRFSIDIEKQKILDASLANRTSQVRVSEDSISFLVDASHPANNEWTSLNLRALISRHTGTIFVHQFGISGDTRYIQSYAKGSCQVPKRRF